MKYGRIPVSKKFIATYCALISFCSTSSVYATSIPSSADPSRGLNQPKPAPQFQIVTPVQKKKESPAALQLQGSEDVKLTLKSIEIEGMTAYAPSSISSIYSPDIGHIISTRRLFEIINAVQQKYLNDGYALTRLNLPEQDISKGNIKIQVIEGYVSEVTLDGDFKNSTSVNDATEQIMAMKPLNTKKLEKLLLNLNDLPDLNVSAILAKPTQNKTAAENIGKVRLILKQNPENSLSAMIGVNNHGSIFSGPYQAVTTVKKASILTPQDQIAATLSAAIPLSEMRFVGLKYQIPLLGARGLNLGFDASFGRTVPGASLKAIEVNGQVQSFKTGLSYSIIRQRDENLALQTSFELRQAKTNVSSSELYDDRLRIFAAGLTYNYADSYNGLNAFEASYSQGLNIMGVREAGSINLSRAEGHPDFKKFYFSAGRLQSLPHHFEFLTALQGQYALDPLLASEEFGFGGAQFGRGYDPSEITGDRGFAGTFELRHALSYSENSPYALQIYGFYDIGKVWNIDPSSKNQISAASSGIGLRIASSNGWSGDINLAFPLTKAASSPPPYTNEHSPRILVSVQKNL